MNYLLTKLKNPSCQVKSSIKCKESLQGTPKTSTSNVVRLTTGDHTGVGVSCKENAWWEIKVASSSGVVRRPKGHEFFPDCEREVMAQWIKWAINLTDKPFLFATLTFKYPVSLYIAERKRNEWLGRMSEALRQITKGSGYLRWISATEWQDRDVIHFHLIISGIGLELLSRKRWESRWRIINGNAKWNERFTGCAIYPGRKKAAPYLAKHHIAKRGEIQRGGIWRGLRTPDALRICGCQHFKSLDNRDGLVGMDELLKRPSASSSRMWGSYPVPKESSSMAHTAL